MGNKTSKAISQNTCMQDWQKRVICERDELMCKINDLSDFFDSGKFISIPKVERTDLYAQCSIMGKYIDVLDRRIKRF